jgi:HEAT repeat protein
MKKIYPIILAAAVAVIALFTSSCGSRSQQSVYDGKPVSEWVSDLNFKNPKPVRDQAQEAMRQIGTNALPFLLKEISDLGELFQQVGATNFLREGQTRYINVHLAFQALGPMAKPAVPALLDLLTNTYTSYNAAFVLTRLDPQTAAVALTQALTNNNLDVRIVAAGELFEVRSNADIALAVPNLVQCLKDISPDKSDSLNLKSAAIIALGNIHTRPDIAVPALLETLTNNDRIIRIVSAKALGRFGNAATSAVPALVQCLKNESPDKSVTSTAIDALGNIHARPDIAVPALVETLTNNDWIIRSMGARALGQFGNAATSAVPALEQATNDSIATLRLVVTAALGKIQTASP